MELTQPVAEEKVGQVLALIDGNSFYCSCERVFEPKLNKVPVIVLSNNDGCAISRTPEAKALGIKMGAPWFQIRELCEREGVVAFSSNYTLYGDMSRRMNDVYRQFTPDVEVYSIDESFLDLTGIRMSSKISYGQEIRGRVKQWTGIPTCVGLGPTKTLAKLANWTAKNYPEFDGVCDYTDVDLRRHMLERIPVSELWGVGRASVPKLHHLGIHTVANLRDAEPKQIRKAMTVVGERMVLELRGVPCLPLELVPPTPKGCAVTRSFGRAVTRVEEMIEAVASYATRAAEKLRSKKVATCNLTVFMHTNAFNGDPWRSVSKTVSLPEPSNDTLDLVAYAVSAARKLWKGGYRYAKAGIILTELVPTSFLQSSFLHGFAGEDLSKSVRLMAALDEVNQRWGRGTLSPAAMGIRNRWAMRREKKSPHYTTELGELPVARASRVVIALPSGE